MQENQQFEASLGYLRSPRVRKKVLFLYQYVEWDDHDPEKKVGQHAVWKGIKCKTQN